MISFTVKKNSAVDEVEMKPSKKEKKKLQQQMASDEAPPVKVKKKKKKSHSVVDDDAPFVKASRKVVDDGDDGECDYVSIVLTDISFYEPGVIS